MFILFSLCFFFFLLAFVYLFNWLIFIILSIFGVFETSIHLYFHRINGKGYSIFIYYFSF